MDNFEKLLNLLHLLGPATVETLQMVLMALLWGGLGGLIVGVLLYTTKTGGLTPNRLVYFFLNVLVNFFRPIPFIIFIAAVQPLSRAVVGTGYGVPAATFALSLAAVFGISRLVEQNLVSVPGGVLEAALSLGASRFRIILTVLLPEALGPLILGYTFAVVALVDMSAVAGYIAAGGLGDFAIQYGYRVYNPWVTWTAVLIIVIIVQALQFFGNWLSKKFIRN
ncbi:MAG: ABC transporter permease [Microbacteriaceae bacterium]|nr:ABC transporter permease [Microbacteriaceae bacterium]